MQVQTQEEADMVFEAMLEMSLSEGIEREKALEITKSNLGYYAGYYSDETRARVERLFHCQHPVFGLFAETGPIDPEKAFKMGLARGEEIRKRREKKS